MVLDYIWRNIVWVLKFNLERHQIVKVYRFQRPILDRSILRFNVDVDARRVEGGVVIISLNCIIESDLHLAEKAQRLYPSTNILLNL